MEGHAFWLPSCTHQLMQQSLVLSCWGSEVANFSSHMVKHLHLKCWKIFYQLCWKPYAINILLQSFNCKLWVLCWAIKIRAKQLGNSWHWWLLYKLITITKIVSRARLDQSIELSQKHKNREVRLCIQRNDWPRRTEWEQAGKRNSWICSHNA